MTTLPQDLQRAACALEADVTRMRAQLGRMYVGDAPVPAPNSEIELLEQLAADLRGLVTLQTARRVLRVREMRS
jgi:hypothetical protein